MKKFFLLLIMTFLLNCTSGQQKLLELNKTPTKNGRPNVILILADDMGYSDLSCYGGEILTPNIDELADKGVKFSNFYNAAVCSPSRASLLTGMYPHQVGMGDLAHEEQGNAGPYQGYLSKIPNIASILKQADYSTYMVGKWHLGQAKENWPLQYGFDKYFGLLSGASSYFEIIENQPRVRKMAHQNEEWTPPKENFYMTTAFSDTAVSYIQQHNTENPFFIYLSYTAPHWPLHALEEDIALFEAQYQAGWDSLATARLNKMKELKLVEDDLQLPQRPENIPAWGSLSAQEQKDWARLMAVYAAMIYRMDKGIGEIVEALKEKGINEKTIILFASDNGADRQDVRSRAYLNENREKGKPLNDPNVLPGLQGSYTSYLTPWARLSNIPYGNYKGTSYWGGMRTPFIVYDPRNTEFSQLPNIEPHSHFIDVLPTILSMVGVKPNKSNFEGKDLTPLLKHEVTDTTFQDRCIFIERYGYKAVIQGKWKLLKEPHHVGWQLFDLEADPLETTDALEGNNDQAYDLAKKYFKWEERTSSYSKTKYFEQYNMHKP